MKILITGGAGFIGSTFVRMMFRGLLPNLENFQMVTVFDSLSIGGSLKNLSPVKDDSRFRFVKGDIRDVPLLNKEIKGNEFVIQLCTLLVEDRAN